MSKLGDLQIVQDITKTILNQVKKAIDKAPFDKTFTATIAQEISSRQYTVFYAGKFINVYSVYECELGDVVRVCAPQNDWTKCFVVVNAGHEYDPATDQGTTVSGASIEIGTTASKLKDTLLFDTDND